MDFLVFSLGICGFVGGVIAIVALISQRDANRLKEQEKEGKPVPTERSA